VSVELVDPKATDRVLEVGCGRGVAAAALGGFREVARDCDAPLHARPATTIRP
jgi:protein-L-isoaspartate O-methyltransferase